MLLLVLMFLLTLMLWKPDLTLTWSVDLFSNMISI